MPKEHRNYRFPLPDEIRWVEHELGSAKSGHIQHWPLRQRPVDLQIWLARTRDRKSWRQIGDEFFPTITVEAGRSEARRAYDRVERLLEDADGLESRIYRLRARIEEVFGVSADEFRAFVRTGQVPRPRKPRRK